MVVDVTLVKRCMEGDTSSCEKLYELCRPQVFHTVFLLTNSYHMADDITQEVLLTVFRSIRSLRKPESFSSWIYQIALNISKRKGRFKELPVEQIESTSSESDVENIVLSEELKGIIWKEIESLSDTLKAPVILRYFNDLSVEEIAVILDCPTGTVKSRLSAARNRLAKKLRNKMEGTHYA